MRARIGINFDTGRCLFALHEKGKVIAATVFIPSDPTNEIEKIEKYLKGRKYG